MDDPAVVELAADLDSPQRRAALLAASDVLERLDDPDLAWRAYACGLLADALGEEEEQMSENRYDGELEEPGDPLEQQEQDESQDGEPWAKTSSGDADDDTSD